MIIMFCMYIVDGGWNEWKDISPCHATCGQGLKAQSRSCSEPRSSCGGKPCVGPDFKFAACNISSCCPG